jgi:hypothetical protein
LEIPKNNLLSNIFIHSKTLSKKKMTDCFARKVPTPQQLDEAWDIVTEHIDKLSGKQQQWLLWILDQKRIRLRDNVILCLECKDVLESTYGHDFRQCTCKKSFVDGGREPGFARWSGPAKHFDNLKSAIQERDLLLEQ